MHFLQINPFFPSYVAPASSQNLDISISDGSVGFNATKDVEMRHIHPFKNA